MIHFPDGGRRFNMRAAGVILREGHVLVTREDDDAFVMLPGGRVEIGEPSSEAMRREIEEELKQPGEIGRLLFTAENFYHLGGNEFHQIATYYAVAIDGAFPFVTDGPCLVTQDEGHELTFFWVPVEAAALTKINLLPAWLRHRLDDLPEATEHIVIDER